MRDIHNRNRFGNRVIYSRFACSKGTFNVALHAEKIGAYASVVTPFGHSWTVSVMWNRKEAK